MLLPQLLNEKKPVIWQIKFEVVMECIFQAHHLYLDHTPTKNTDSIELFQIDFTLYKAARTSGVKYKL